MVAGAKALRNPDRLRQCHRQGGRLRSVAAGDGGADAVFDLTPGEAGPSENSEAWQLSFPGSNRMDNLAKAHSHLVAGTRFLATNRHTSSESAPGGWGGVWDRRMSEGKRSKRAAKRPPAHPRTPDGRYFVVNGRLWRCSDPALPDAVRQGYVDALMAARRAVSAAKRAQRSGDPDAAATCTGARRAVQAAKEALGERGPVWWSDGAPDENRKAVHNSSYAGWYAALGAGREA